MRKIIDPDVTVRIHRDTRRMMERVRNRRRWSLKTIVDEGVRRLLAEDEKIELAGVVAVPAGEAETH